MFTSAHRIWMSAVPSALRPQFIDWSLRPQYPPLGGCGADGVVRTRTNCGHGRQVRTPEGWS